MDRLDKEIGAAIRKIAGEAPRLYTGYVVTGSVDIDNGECKVVLSIDDEDAPTSVFLKSAYQSGDGVLVIPEDRTGYPKTFCVVGELDGPGKYTMLKCDRMKEVRFKIGDNVVGYVTGSSVKLFFGGTKELFVENGKLHFQNESGSLKTGIDNLIDQIKLITVPTGTGPSGVPANAAAFTSIKTYFNNLLF